MEEIYKYASENGIEIKNISTQHVYFSVILKITVPESVEESKVILLSDSGLMHTITDDVAGKLKDTYGLFVTRAKFCESFTTMYFMCGKLKGNDVFRVEIDIGFWLSICNPPDVIHTPDLSFSIAIKTSTKAGETCDFGTDIEAASRYVADEIAKVFEAPSV